MPVTKELFKGRFLDLIWKVGGRVHCNGHMSDSEAGVELASEKSRLGLNKAMQWEAYLVK